MTDWKKLVKLNWRLWCGNVWPAEVDAICDGFSVFTRAGADAKRYAKLAEQQSIRVGAYPGLTLNTEGARGLTMVNVYEMGDGWRTTHLHALAELRASDDTLVLVNAERLRNALVVAPAKGLYLGSEGWVYLTTERPDGTLSMFDEAPTPVGAIAPMLHPYRILRRLEDGHDSRVVWTAGSR